MSQLSILIVGASQGIGEAIAMEFAKGKHHIALTARRAEQLEKVSKKIQAAGSEALAIEADALDKQRAVEVIDEVVNKFGRLDIIVLVVGGAPPIFTYEISSEKMQQLMDLNFQTMVNYFCPAVAQMRKQGMGQIAHMNTLASMIPLPRSGPYSATKLACSMFLETARIELLKDQISITQIYPGFIDTSSQKNVPKDSKLLMQLDYVAPKIVSAILRKKRALCFPRSLYYLIQIASILPFFIRKFIYSFIK